MIKPFDVEGVESDKVEFKCQALGVPLPKYSWVDKEGIDVRQKEGDIITSYKLNISRSGLSGSKVDEQTGTMTLFTVNRRDVGTYTCR